MIVAVAGFFDAAELHRLARVRRSAAVFSGLGLAAVLVLGVLEGLVVAAGLSLAYGVMRLSRPHVTVLRDAGGEVVLRCGGPLLHPNDNSVKDRVLELAAGARVVVLDLEASTELDVQSADTLAERAHALRARGAELRLTRVNPPAYEVLRRSGVADQVATEAR